MRKQKHTHSQQKENYNLAQYVVRVEVPFKNSVVLETQERNRRVFYFNSMQDIRRMNPRLTWPISYESIAAQW